MSLVERVLALLLVGAMLSVARPGAAAGRVAPSGAHALLDVPYVSQTPELCGGAAVAMVLRYWGERNVFPQDFAALVTAGDGGILTGTLASAVRDRGWQAVVSPAADDPTRTDIRSQLDQGRPLIALIEVAPRTYHYVVMVGSTDREVVVHDPARAPFRVLPWTEFDRAWAATGRWMMLVLPPEGIREGGPAAPAAPAAAESTAHGAQTPCRALVDSSVRMALGGDADGAEHGLVAATGLCPQDPASWLELAGWRFSHSRWSEAQDLALSAVRLSPEDAYGWQLVATTRYLMGDLTGALDAWNRTGEPRIDRIDIRGAERTRQPVIVRAAGLKPRQVLTPGTLGRARRRLGDLPAAPNARIRYEPMDGGLAAVDVAIDERNVVPSGRLAFAALGARALLLHELQVDVAGSLGAGEVGSAAWRWSAGRPRVAIGLALPSPQWLSGIVSVDGMWERQSYGATSGADAATVVREDRRRVGLHFADWSATWLRWQAGAALDRLHEYNGLNQHRFDARDYLAVESALDVRLAADRFAAMASGGWWAPFAGGDRFVTGGLLAAWRSTADATHPFWSAVTEVSVASHQAPLALWQGAGTGQGRSGLLRAHPLLNHNLLTGPVFGRQVAHGSIEYARPLARSPAGSLSVAGFADAARASHRLDGLGPSPLLVDVGAGLRVYAPRAGGAIRIDVAHGVRGGGATLSAGWGGVWPR